MRVAGWSIWDLVLLCLVTVCAVLIGIGAALYLWNHGVIDGFMPTFLIADIVPALVVGGVVALRVKHRRYP